MDRYTKYAALSAKIRATVLADLGTINPALGSQFGLHYAHNWYRCSPEKPESGMVCALVDKYEALDSALYKRRVMLGLMLEIVREMKRYGKNSALESAMKEAAREYRNARTNYLALKHFPVIA